MHHDHCVKGKASKFALEVERTDRVQVNLSGLVMVLLLPLLLLLLLLLTCVSTLLGNRAGVVGKAVFYSFGVCEQRALDGIRLGLPCAPFTFAFSSSSFSSSSSSSSSSSCPSSPSSN